MQAMNAHSKRMRMMLLRSVFGSIVEESGAGVSVSVWEPVRVWLGEAEDWRMSVLS